jgi:DnaJ-class molecular chaperone
MLDLEDLEALRVLADASRAWLDLHTECDDCGGDGLHDDVEYTASTFDDVVVPCPGCGGRGYTLNPERLEAAAKATDYHQSSVRIPMDEGERDALTTTTGCDDDLT